MNEYTPNFHLHSLRKHSSGGSHPERIAILGGNEEALRDPGGLIPGRLVSRAGVCPLVMGVVGGAEAEERKVLRGSWLLLISLFYLHLCGDQGRAMFSPIFPSYLCIFFFR